MKIATWNVNSIKVREDQVLDWLEQHDPDVLCLQETKVTDQEFPEDGFGDLDYDVEFFGQAAYNGVALISHEPLDDVVRGFADDEEDADRRLIAATVGGVRIVDVYMPNGQSLDSDKYGFKLAWMAKLRAFLDADADPASPLVLCGDFNIAPLDGDHFAAKPGDESIFVSTRELDAFRHLLDFGLTDALQHVNPGPKQYTWWDYRGGAWDRNNGMRIDHFLVTQPVLDRLKSVTIHREVRGWDQPSDHVPVMLELED